MKVKGEIVSIGKSLHCFLNKDGDPVVNLKKHLPELDQILDDYLDQDKEE